VRHLQKRWWTVLASVVFVILVASYFAVAQGRVDQKARDDLVDAKSLLARIEEGRAESVRQINMINRAQCASLRNLYAVIRKSLKDGDIELGRITYYREHPAERARARERTRQTISQFRQPSCPPNVSITPEPKE